MWPKEKKPGKSRRVYDHSMIRNHSGAPTQPHHALSREAISAETPSFLITLCPQRYSLVKAPFHGFPSLIFG
jgi:hypothetical protein